MKLTESMPHKLNHAQTAAATASRFHWFVVMRTGVDHAGDLYAPR